MNTHFLTTKYFIKGKFFDLLEKIIPGEIDLTKNELSSNYKLIKWIKKQDKDNLTSVGFFKYKDKKVVIKIVRFKLKNSIYEQLINEASMLNFLAKVSAQSKGIKLIFPKVHDLIYQNNQLALVTEYLDADLLISKSNEFKMNILKDILKKYKEMTLHATNEDYKCLPKRTYLQIIISFPVYLLKVMLYDLDNYSYYVKLMFIFYRNYFSINNFKMKYTLAHKDLHSNNILIKNNSVMIIDPEICVLADEVTDIAQIARLYSAEFSEAEMNSFLNDTLSSLNDKKHFIALTIFYSIQMMAIRNTNDSDYKEAYDYLLKYSYLFKINSDKNEKLTFVEIVYFKILNAISKINAHTKFNKNKVPIILCYHGISDDGWRFSTSKKDFISQINYLKKYYTIIPLKQLLSLDSKQLNGVVSLTFDDGYAELVELIPFFKKNKILGTLFVLGDPKKANRDELDNSKKIMKTQDILKFKEIGWEIGFHTSTHSDLSKLDKNALNEEIVMSKIRLEKELGFKLDLFAYPRGIYNKEIIDFVNKAGFKAAFTVDGGKFSKDDSVFKFDRVSIEGNLSMNNFKTLISPVGLYFNMQVMNMFKLKNNLGL